MLGYGKHPYLKKFRITMPRLATLIEDFAARFNFEQTKLTSLARALREAGLITQGARGVNAPAATAMDASRLLIAMMLDCRIATAAEDVTLFTSFKPFGPATRVGSFAPVTLGDGLEKLIQLLGREPFEHMEDGPLRDFDAEVVLTPFAAQARIKVSGAKSGGEIQFGHPALADAIEAASSDIDAAANAIPASFHEDLKRFPAGFYQQPTLGFKELFAVGQVVAGHKPAHWQPA